MRQILLLLALSVFIFSCGGGDTELRIQEVKGEAQGTTYTIKYVDTLNRNLKHEIDSILLAIDLSVSTYNSNSILSRFNQSDSCMVINEFVLDLFLMSDEVNVATDGAFDPSVKLISNIWGFGDSPLDTDTLFQDAASNKEREELLLALRDSLSEEAMEELGWQMVLLDGDILYNNVNDILNSDFDDNYLCKEEPGMQLSFDAIAQGYSADVIGDYLQYKKGIRNYLIEIGGEILAQGRKPDNKRWKVQIENPDINNQGASNVATVEMKNFRALAVSGSYRNFREYNGVKYGHCIDPRTGNPSKSTIVSASVFASDCAIADAYATAFMVMGIEEAVPFIEGNPFAGIEALFVYYNEDGRLETYVTSGLEPYIKVPQLN